MWAIDGEVEQRLSGPRSISGQPGGARKLRQVDPLPNGPTKTPPDPMLYAGLIEGGNRRPLVDRPHQDRR
jgi:hypothetical protein